MDKNQKLFGRPKTAMSEAFASNKAKNKERNYKKANSNEQNRSLSTSQTQRKIKNKNCVKVSGVIITNNIGNLH